MNLRIGTLFLVTVLTTSCLGAEAPALANQASAGQAVVERDPEKEDQLGKLFETIRSDANIPPLKRIRHRASLEQKVCTIATTGTLPKYISMNSAFYKIADPVSISAEFKTIALYKDAGFPRYSVAIWRIKSSLGGDTYWVGVELYWSAALEWFNSYLTDGMYYRNEWKKSVAPSCRGK
jgi:hypothetical protein